jgi:hypothetical protein
MVKQKVYTAAEFAKKMSVSRRTATRWLTAGIVPGAVLKSSPELGQWWEIPESALKMPRPAMGPKPGGPVLKLDKQRWIQRHRSSLL